MVTHDRYFLERTCYVTYALIGHGSGARCRVGVEHDLESRRGQPDSIPAGPPGRPTPPPPALPRLRQGRKDLARIEAQLATLSRHSIAGCISRWPARGER